VGPIKSSPVRVNCGEKKNYDNIVKEQMKKKFLKPGVIHQKVKGRGGGIGGADLRGVGKPVIERMEKNRGRQRGDWLRATVKGPTI